MTNSETEIAMQITSSSWHESVTVKNPQLVPRVGEEVLFPGSAQRVVNRVTYDYRNNAIYVRCD